MDKTPENAENVTLLANLSENMIYMLGFSFVIGSLFTILMLLILDYMRQRREKKDAS